MQMNRKNILIIEDEPDICWALERILKSRGLIPLVTLTGYGALAVLKTHRVSLVFLDAKLPDIDGIDLARRIKGIDPGIPIIMISGYFYREDDIVREAMGNALICNFISKPFHNEDVLKVLGETSLL